MNNQRVTFKPWVKVLLCCLFLFFIYVSITLIVNGTKPELISGDSYSLTKKQSSNYKVYLLDNSFYDEAFLDEGWDQYPSAIIDFVDLNMVYDYLGSLPANLSYTYGIEGTIIGNYENTSNGKSELWTKKYTLVNPTTVNLTDRSSFSINQNVRVNFQEYNKVVNDFKSNFRLAIDAYLNVKMTVNVEGTVEGIDEKINETSINEVNIPLNMSAISISKKVTPLENKLIENESTEKYHLFITYAGVVLLLLVILLFIASFKYIFYSSKSEYRKTFNKLIKNYAEIMVEVEDLPETEELELLEITNFDDMIDLEEELKSPILYKENIPGYEAEFIIVVDGYAYRYMLERRKTD